MFFVNHVRRHISLGVLLFNLLLTSARSSVTRTTKTDAVIMASEIRLIIEQADAEHAAAYPEVPEVNLPLKLFISLLLSIKHFIVDIIAVYKENVKFQIIIHVLVNVIYIFIPQFY